MKHNATKNCPLHPFEWTPARREAATLVADDRLNDADIARQVGVSRRTLAYWKTNPVFAAAVVRHVDGYAEELRKRSIRLVLERLGGL